MPEPLRFRENNSSVLQLKIEDRDGNLITGDDLSWGTLTLWDIETGQIINGRSHQDILGVGSPAEENDVTIYGELQTDPTTGNEYNLLWNIQSEDNAIITDRRQMERHRALFHFKSATDEILQEIDIEVENLRRVHGGSPE